MVKKRKIHQTSARLMMKSPRTHRCMRDAFCLAIFPVAHWNHLHIPYSVVGAWEEGVERRLDVWMDRFCIYYKLHPNNFARKYLLFSILLTPSPAISFCCYPPHGRQLSTVYRNRRMANIQCNRQTTILTFFFSFVVFIDIVIYLRQ